MTLARSRRAATHLACFLAIALGTVLVPAPCAAQNAPAEGANEMQLGPVQTSQRLSWQTEYDENVYRSATAPVADVLSTLSGNTSVRAQLRRVNVTGSASAEWVHYASLMSERGANLGTGVQLQFLFSRIVPYVRSNFNNTRNRINPEIDTRPRAQQSHIAAGGMIRVGGKTGVDISTGRSALVYDRNAEFNGVNLSQSLNRTSEHVALSLRQEVTPLTRVLVTGEVRRDLFDVSASRNSENLGLTAGFQSDGRINGHASAGMRLHKPQDPSLREARSFLLNVGTDATVKDRVHIGVTADYDLQPSYRPDLNYYPSFGYDTSVTCAVRGSLRLSANVGQRYSDYGSVPSFTDSEPAMDRETRYGTGVNYRLGNSLSFTFAGMYSQRTSVSAVRRFNSVNLRVGVSHAF